MENLLVKIDWVSCPICGSPDCRRELYQDDAALIECTNHACRSNGGSYQVGAPPLKAPPPVFQKQFLGEPTMTPEQFQMRCQREIDWVAVRGTDPMILERGILLTEAIRISLKLEKVMNMLPRPAAVTGPDMLLTKVVGALYPGVPIHCEQCGGPACTEGGILCSECAANKDGSVEPSLLDRHRLAIAIANNKAVPELNDLAERPAPPKLCKRCGAPLYIFGNYCYECETEGYLL